MHEKLKDATILLLEIISLLVIFVVFLFVLNYFKIITLPNFSPKTTTTSPIIPTTPTNAPATNNNQSAGVSFIRLQNQATESQMAKYKTYAISFSDDIYVQQSDSYLSHGVFSGYDNQTIQVVTKDGVLNLGFDQNTLFQKLPSDKNATASANSDGVQIVMTPYASQQDFFKNVSFGSVVQIFYSKTNLKATQINYLEYIPAIQ